MDGVVQGVEVVLLAELGQIGLALGGAVLGVNAHLQILLGAVGDDLAQQLGELRGVLSLFQSGLLPVERDLGIALARGDTAHGQIHADLGALALKVGAQTGDDLFLNLSRNVRAEDLADADNVLGGPAHLAGLLHELGGGNLTYRAELGGRVALMNVTANAANPLFHVCEPPVI